MCSKRKELRRPGGLWTFTGCWCRLQSLILLSTLFYLSIVSTFLSCHLKVNVTGVLHRFCIKWCDERACEDSLFSKLRFINTFWSQQDRYWVENPPFEISYKCSRNLFELYFASQMADSVEIKASSFICMNLLKSSRQVKKFFHFFICGTICLILMLNFTV